MVKAKADKPREYTTEEVRKKFLDHCAGILEYWLKCDRAPSTREKMEGLLFSVFAAIDGSACDLPAFLVAPMPCKEDKAFCKKEGENWYPYNDDTQVKSDIAGCLHDQYAKYMKAEPGAPEEPPTVTVTHAPPQVVNGKGVDRIIDAPPPHRSGGAPKKHR